jgi:hypothetical protein
MSAPLQVADPSRVRWPGSGSNPAGLTPFAFYDTDPQFLSDASSSAVWAADRLGYPIVDIELLDINFYACFEEAITEYGAQVNQFNIINNITLLQGTSTSVSATGRNVMGSGLPYLIKLSKAYGTEAGTGGNVDWKRGMIPVTTASQNYDLQALWGNTIESGSRIEIKRIFHEQPSAISRVYDPYSMTGMSYSNILSEMGFAGYSPAVQFLMTPIFEDLLRVQAIDFNDMVRKSAYSFELVNNKLRIFPFPTNNYNLYFEYILESDRDAAIYNGESASGSLSGSGDFSQVSDYSNVPYDIIPYHEINSVGKQWIRKYFLALCKEVLGSIRQKYSTIPIPGSEVSLDGAELRQEASAEKETLVTQLRENLEAMSRSAQMEKKANEMQQVQDSLKGVPLLIYIGVWMISFILIL